MKFFTALATFHAILPNAATSSGDKDHPTRSLRGQGLFGGSENDSESKTYILTFPDDGTDPGKRAEALAKAGGGSVRHVYRRVLNGAALTLPAAAAAGMANSASVRTIHEDQEVHAIAEKKSWGQDRIDQCEAIGDSPDATFTKKDASGVKVYIIDTGIYADNNDFTGLIDPNDSCHQSFDIKGKANPLADGNGHGTHVASTTCGNQYGVVSCGSGMLCAVQVLDSRGSGSTSGVIAGVEHAAQDCSTKGYDKCVANMSLGGSKYSPLDDAVQNAVAAGVVMVVAAGNEGSDACDYSPAAAADAITVGSTDSQDRLSSWSNFGSCVDVFAPGSSITAAWQGSATATNTISGTSMASPHVAGLAAAKLQEGTPAAEVIASLKADVTLKGVDCRYKEQGIATIGTGLDCAATVNDCRGVEPGPSPAPGPTPSNCVAEGDNCVAQSNCAMFGACCCDGLTCEKVGSGGYCRK